MKKIPLLLALGSFAAVLAFPFFAQGFVGVVELSPSQISTQVVDGTGNDNYLKITIAGQPHTLNTFGIDREGDALVGCDVEYYESIEGTIAKVLEEAQAENIKVRIDLNLWDTDRGHSHEVCAEGERAVIWRMFTLIKPEKK